MNDTKLKSGRRKSITKPNTTVMAIPEPIIDLLDSIVNGWDINNRTAAIKTIFKNFPKSHIEEIIKNNEKNHLVALSKGEYDELMKIKNSFPHIKFQELLHICAKNITRKEDEDVILPDEPHKICDCGHEEKAHVEGGCFIDECTCGGFQERK